MKREVWHGEEGVAWRGRCGMEREVWHGEGGMYYMG